MIFLVRSAKVFVRKISQGVPEKPKDLITFESFLTNQPTNSRKTNIKIFRAAIDFYLHKQGTLRRGHVEFINGALENMKKFNIHDNLDSYVDLLEVFPKGTMVAQSAWQREFIHYPKQQYCCVFLLTCMEQNGVIPSEDMGMVISSIFGINSHAMKKYLRTMYWVPKIKGMNPLPVPQFPTDIADQTEMDLAIARMALKRMSFDLEAVITCHKLEAERVPAYILSSQSPSQRELLEKTENEEFFISGPYRSYLRSRVFSHYVLMSRGGGTVHVGDESFFNFYFENEEDCRKLNRVKSVHEQEDGTILSLCIIVGEVESTSRCLHEWLRFLQVENQSLKTKQVNIRLAEEPI